MTSLWKAEGTEASIRHEKPIAAPVASSDEFFDHSVLQKHTEKEFTMN
jgi:hypothetical protein